MKYRVREAFIAVCDNAPNPFTFVTLPPGEMITLVGTVQQSGLVDVRYDGQVVAVFMRDVENRTDLVDGEPKASA